MVGISAGAAFYAVISCAAYYCIAVRAAVNRVIAFAAED